MRVLKSSAPSIKAIKRSIAQIVSQEGTATQLDDVSLQKAIESAKIQRAVCVRDSKRYRLFDKAIDTFEGFQKKRVTPS